MSYIIDIFLVLFYIKDVKYIRHPPGRFANEPSKRISTAVWKVTTSSSQGNRRFQTNHQYDRK